MIETSTSNLLEGDVEALVNAVNCVGIMGKGLALEFKKAYPEMFREYAAICAAGALLPGHLHVYEAKAGTPKYIINFPTKRHWKTPSHIADISTGLAALVDKVQQLGIRSVAMPALGCGLGGLCWSDVEPLIRSAFKDLEMVRVLVFPPQ